MGAARYIGRVGGLAVALGVGTAILTGYGVASAEPASAGSSSTASESTAPAGESGSTRTPGSTQSSSHSSIGRRTAPSGSDSGAVSTTERSTRSAPPGEVVTRAAR